jgi:hypothetical protein
MFTYLFIIKVQVVIAVESQCFVNTCKGVFIYFYIKLCTLDGITVHVNIKQ